MNFVKRKIKGCIWLLALGQVHASTNSAPLSPLKHWEASWAASCAHGTIMVLSQEQGSTLVVLRSPNSQVYKPPLPVTGSPEKHPSGLLASPYDPSRLLVQYAPSCFPLTTDPGHPMLLCAMTGFAADVEHLALQLQEFYQSRINLLDRPPTLTNVLTFWSRLGQEAAMTKSGRPYGVQGLMVGASGMIRTLDPSGAWQSWRRATAIGKSAAAVRAEMAERLAPNMSLPDALRCLLQSWWATSQKENRNSDDNYQVYLVEDDRLWVLDEDYVRGILEQVQTEKN